MKKSDWLIVTVFSVLWIVVVYLSDWVRGVFSGFGSKVIFFVLAALPIIVYGALVRLMRLLKDKYLS